jgi:hypothetical protein
MGNVLHLNLVSPQIWDLKKLLMCLTSLSFVFILYTWFKSDHVKASVSLLKDTLHHNNTPLIIRLLKSLSSCNFSHVICSDRISVERSLCLQENRRPNDRDFEIRLEPLYFDCSRVVYRNDTFELNKRILLCCLRHHFHLLNKNYVLYWYSCKRHGLWLITFMMNSWCSCSRRVFFSLSFSCRKFLTWTKNHRFRKES